ncbi:MAG: exodeoxyribonuclease VII large subunit [Planctomycetota bacterium]
MDDRRSGHHVSRQLVDAKRDGDVTMFDDDLGLDGAGGNGIGGDGIGGEPRIPEMTVSQFNQSVKMLIEQAIPEIQLRGEVSGLARPRSGHLYFTLKDDQSQLRCVMWRDAARRIESSLGKPLRDGDAVHCGGRVDVYVPRGQYQLSVVRLTQAGVGTLQQRFEGLKAKLNAEGWFDADRKRPIVSVPRRIAVVTSPSGAAIRDFLQAAGRRWNGVEIIVVPTRVQGDGSAREVARAIGLAQQLQPRCDTIVITRGGGSMEDLWSFNEEVVVHAVGKCSIPMVSAIGHEIDVTLCDLVADRRAMTPTDAANVALPDRDSIAEMTRQFRKRLDESLRNQIRRLSTQLDFLAERPCLARPDEWIQDRHQMLDYLDQNLQTHSRRILESGSAQLSSLAASLDALSPLKVLARGYSVTLRDNGALVQSSADVRPGDEIETRVADGTFRSRVI